MRTVTNVEEITWQVIVLIDKLEEVKGFEKQEANKMAMKIKESKEDRNCFIRL